MLSLEAGRAGGGGSSNLPFPGAPPASAEATPKTTADIPGWQRRRVGPSGWGGPTPPWQPSGAQRSRVRYQGWSRLWLRSSRRLVTGLLDPSLARPSPRRRARWEQLLEQVRPPSPGISSSQGGSRFQGCRRTKGPLAGSRAPGAEPRPMPSAAEPLTLAVEACTRPSCLSQRLWAPRGAEFSQPRSAPAGDPGRTPMCSRGPEGPAGGWGPRRPRTAQQRLSPGSSPGQLGEDSSVWFCRPAAVGEQLPGSWGGTAQW